MTMVRDWLDERADALLRVAVGSAVVLLLAYVASKLAGDVISEDPTGYRLLTLCGFVAAVAVAIGAWREDGGAAAALVAAAAFGFVAYAVGSYWYSVVWGSLGDPAYQPSPLLPFFAVVAVVGAASAVALIVAWRPPRAERGRA